MKLLLTLNKVITSILIIFINGCYTVIWTPEERMPSESDYSNENILDVNEEYYPIVLYGGYNYYYTQPWWYSLSYNFNIPINDAENNLSDSESVRNSVNGRNIDSGRDPILETTPPSRSSNSGNNTNSNTGTTTQTDNSNARSQNSGNDNSIRNDNGSRNSEGKRK